MSKKLLLVYILFFVSLNAMAALESIDCKDSQNKMSSKDLEKSQKAYNNLDVNQYSLMNKTSQCPDKITTDSFSNLYLSEKEPMNGALTFILLIPALLVFVFTGFKKSNK